MRSRQFRRSGLIRLPNWIGDGVMAAPAVLGLGRALPDWDWHLLGNSRTLPLYKGLGPPFRLLPQLSGSASRPLTLILTALHLRRAGFSAAAVLPPSFSSALMAAMAGIPIRAGRGSDWRGLLLNPALPREVRTRHLRGQHAEVAAALLDRIRPGGEPWALSPDSRRLPLLAEEIEWAGRWYLETGFDPSRTLFLAPGATFGSTKRWPADRFASLGRELAREGWNVVILGGREEEADAAELASSLRGSAPEAGGAVISMAGGLSLRESMALMAQGRAAVSNDSGAMHLAQAAGCPVVGIFGSTSPLWTGPGGSRQRIIYSGLHCSPCFSAKCPTRIECLDVITVEEVRRALDDLLRPGSPDAGRPAVFMDRDGTLLELVPYLSRAELVKLTPGAGAALRRLRDAGYAIVVATNQSGVARGLLDAEGLRSIHLWMEELLGKEGAALDGIEFCPHHPDHTGPCACRKPLPGMLRRAAHFHGLDLRRSFMIGDSGSDIEAGRRAGVRTVLVRTGYGREVEETLKRPDPGPCCAAEMSPRPDSTADDLGSAADWILSEGGSRR